MKYEYITKTAEQVRRSWTNKQKIQFHYFNPNGVYARKKVLDDAIWELVEQGKCKSGAVLAFGSGNSFRSDELRELFNKSRVTDTEYYVLIQGYEADIARAWKFIEEVA
jgi:hypothetical protein